VLEVVQESLGVAGVAERPQHQLRKRLQRAGLELLVGEMGEVIDQNREARHQLGHASRRGRRRDHVVQVHRCRPAVGCVADHERDDQRKWAAALPVTSLPDPHDVAEGTQGHRGIVGALVFEQDVEQDFFAPLAMEAHGEEQVAVAAAQCGIDERARFEHERAPVDAAHQLRW
jgi:hypothetical protein